MVLSIWIGGNFLGIIDLAEVIKLRVFFQYFWSMGCNSTNEGLGPHKTHKVTSWTNSHVTNRKGTFKKRIIEIIEAFKLLDGCGILVELVKNTANKIPTKEVDEYQRKYYQRPALQFKAVEGLGTI